jgi:predicted transposase YdaD
MICLGDSHGDNYSGILKLLDVLLSSERKPEEKKKILENDFSIEMTKSLEREVSVMCNLSKGVEERGITKGITQGITQGILSSIQNLMESMSWSAEQAMNALKIPEEERSKYANEINKK